MGQENMLLMSGIHGISCPSECIPIGFLVPIGNFIHRGFLVIKAGLDRSPSLKAGVVDIS